YANMHIDSIRFRGSTLTYTREYNAVYVHFPSRIPAGTVGELPIVYAGNPQLVDRNILRGGFIWTQNREGKLWIESVCQGSGASLWWPCKDHLSDKPDSMHIAVTIPGELTEVSNGRLLSKKALPDNRTRYDWYV